MRRGQEAMREAGIWRVRLPFCCALSVRDAGALGVA